MASGEYELKCNVSTYQVRIPHLWNNKGNRQRKIHISFPFFSFFVSKHSLTINTLEAKGITSQLHHIYQNIKLHQTVHTKNRHLRAPGLRNTPKLLSRVLFLSNSGKLCTVISRRPRIAVALSCSVLSLWPSRAT